MTQPAEGVDVAVRIDGAPARLAPGVAEIALCSLAAEQSAPQPAVSIRTAAAGVEAGGPHIGSTACRSTLQAPRPSGAPTAAAL